MNGDTTKAIVEFFTNPVDLPKKSSGQKIDSIWWEYRKGWKYPWRITGDREGYPCGEPKKV
jgi:hypothetical protein